MYNNIIPKVLIVDDLKNNRLIIKLFLRKNAQYNFIEACNGQEGIDMAIKEQPHIILMDAMMPVIDGFEAIRQIRNNPLTQNIPILMVSALDNKNEKVKALQSGISDFISKPLDQTELTIRVNSLLNIYIQFLEKQKELKDINTNLEAKVNEKFNRRMEEIKLASIGEMAAGITHELNTPVTYMKSNIEMLAYDIEDIKDNEQIKASMFTTIHTLNDGIKRLRNIIDTTREISKKGQNKKVKENVFSSLILSTRMIYNRSKHLAPIYINNTKFTLDINENFQIFNADIIKQKIEQVWIIILNNACDEFQDSTKEYDNRRIDIYLSQKEKKTIIKFIDNANNGISKDILPKIFEPFSSTKTDKGVGIGLNIAKQIIEQHNGTIKAYNEKNCAVFEIEI